MWAHADVVVLVLPSIQGVVPELAKDPEFDLKLDAVPHSLEAAPDAPQSEELEEQKQDVYENEDDIGDK